MTNDHPPHIWDKRETESDKAYAAFLLYRDLGRGVRSLEQAWKLYRNGNGTGTAMAGFFRDWSAQHDWVARCRAWDAAEQAKDEAALDDLRQLKRVEIVNAELEDYEKLRAKWLELSERTHAVDVKTTLEDGRQVHVLKTKPYEFKALIEGRKKISEGLRLFAELPSKIERNELTGEGGAPIQMEAVDYRDVADLIKPPGIEDDENQDD